MVMAAPLPVVRAGMARPALQSRREALHDTVQERIERFIIDSGSKPGDPLPSQQELARALGISMPSLREAMKSLEALGVIEVRHGSGTFVGRFSLDAMVDGLAFRIRLEAGENRRTVSELLEIRMILEQTYIRQVAAVAAEAQIAALAALVDQMDVKAAAGSEFAEEDWHFHEMLYRPVNNAVLTMLVRAFWEVVDLVKPDLDVAPGSFDVTAREHREIVNALAAHDAERAAAAIEAHFAGIRSRVKHG
jgi:DNA-binding FadR family transcriptional regulator